MRLSAFEGFLLWFVIIIGMIAFGILTNYTIISFMFLLLGVILLAFITISFTDEIRNIFVFKYKIIEKKNVVGRTEFEVKKLICFWLFIPYWKILDYKLHSYDSQNFFGATETNYYSTDITYN